MVPIAIYLAASLLAPVTVQQSASVVQVDPAFPFHGLDADGPVTFNRVAYTTGWTFSGGLVYFTSLLVGGYSWSQLGFSCSSNAEMLIVDISDTTITYDVTAAAGQTSTTKIQVPAGEKVYGVDGADSWSFAAPLLTVTAEHASTRSVVVHMNPVSPGFTGTRDVWGNVFMFVVLILSLGELSRAMQGQETHMPTLMIGLAIVTAILYLLMQAIEGLG